MWSSSRDNWERLVAAVLKKQQIWEQCHQQSISTISSDDLSQCTLSFSSSNLASFSVPLSPSPPPKFLSSISKSAAPASAPVPYPSPSSERIKWKLFSSWYRKKQQDHFYDVPAEEVDPQEVYLGHIKRFSLRQLQVATDNFDNKNILGKGGSGRVYNGRLLDGTLVAIKRLKEERTAGGELHFQTEVEMISMALHRNLLRLRGFCMTRSSIHDTWLMEVLHLVYELINAERLPNEPPLDWSRRKHIALGSARGLSYLIDPKIIHRDVKAANIYLDEEFEAAIGDFGLAKLMDYNDTHVTTAVRGTIGHISPEYLSTGKVSEKSDVFGYGVTLLELITAQRAFDLACLANDDDAMLLDWVKGLLKEKKLDSLVDPDLQNNYLDEEVEQLFQVALLCTRSSPSARPKMSEVVTFLEGDGLAEKWAEWQEEQREEEVELTPHLTSNWIIDSVEDLHAVELSGPR